MKLTEALVEERAAKAVSDCLAEVPFCILKWSKKNVRIGSGEIDALGKLKIDGEEDWTILLEAKREGQPRNIRAAAYSIRRYSESYRRPYGIVVAPYISDPAGAILAAENMGYVDFAGNCRICVGKIYIRKSGQSNPFTEKRDLRSLYSPKAERVLRVLLQEPRRYWLLKPLAEIADVSLGQVANVKKLLDAREWLIVTDKGFRLVAPEVLLQEWSGAYKMSRSRSTEFYSLSSSAEIERALGGENDGPPIGALTAFSAGARFAPMVRYQRVSAYVREDCATVAERMKWKRVPSGGNVVLIEPYDEGVFQGAKFFDGIQIVSPVQAYLDLQGNTGRGAEAAEAILREVLQPSW